MPPQDLLLPPSLREWLPEDHWCTSSDLIDQLDLLATTAVYESRGPRLPAVSPGHADEDVGVIDEEIEALVLGSRWVSQLPALRSSRDARAEDRPAAGPAVLLDRLDYLATVVLA